MTYGESLRLVFGCLKLTFEASARKGYLDRIRIRFVACAMPYIYTNAMPQLSGVIPRIRENPWTAESIF